eukprot:COSAG02_NODE_2657_length_8315_cov_11.405307_1_plen_57_part_10
MPTASTAGGRREPGSRSGQVGSSLTQSLMLSSLGGAPPAEPVPEPDPKLAEGAPAAW